MPFILPLFTALGTVPVEVSMYLCNKGWGFTKLQRTRVGGEMGSFGMTVLMTSE